MDRMRKRKEEDNGTTRVGDRSARAHRVNLVGSDPARKSGSGKKTPDSRRVPRKYDNRVYPVFSRGKESAGLKYERTGALSATDAVAGGAVPFTRNRMKFTCVREWNAPLSSTYYEKLAHAIQRGNHGFPVAVNPMRENSGNRRNFQPRKGVATNKQIPSRMNRKTETICTNARRRERESREIPGPRVCVFPNSYNQPTHSFTQCKESFL